MTKEEENINPIDDWKAVLSSLEEQMEFTDEDIEDNWMDLIRNHSQILYILVKWVIDISENDNLLGGLKSKISDIFEGKDDPDDKKGKAPNPLVV